MIDSEIVYAEVTSEASHYYPLSDTHCWFSDGILAEYGRGVTWGMKSQLMGKRELLSLRVSFPTEPAFHITAHRAVRPFFS